MRGSWGRGALVGVCVVVAGGSIPCVHAGDAASALAPARPMKQADPIDSLFDDGGMPDTGASNGAGCGSDGASIGCGEKPAPGDKGGCGEKPSCGEKPVPGDKGGCGEKPSCGEKPVPGAKGGCGEKPSCGEKPAPGDKGGCGEKPSCGEKPASGAKPGCGEKPSCPPQDEAARDALVPPGVFKKFDVDGDGSLNCSEREAFNAFKRTHMKRFDKDGNGMLNEQERADARKAVMGECPPQSKPPCGPEGRPLPPELLEKFDKDGDGKLNCSERDAMHSAVKARAGSCGEQKSSCGSK